MLIPMHLSLFVLELSEMLLCWDRGISRVAVAKPLREQRMAVRAEVAQSR